MVVHAAFGGSTNLILHLPAIACMPPACAAPPPTIGRASTARAAPGGCAAQRPAGHPTVQVFLAGGVPEVMLHLRRAGLLETSVLTASGQTLGACSTGGSSPSAARALRKALQERDGIDPDDVIMDPDRPRRRGLTSTVMFPTRQPRAGRLGDQEHGHRPHAWWMPTASTA